MDRMACVNLPAFPLQLLIQRHPDWQNHPVAVVDKDKPQGVILWVNKQARRSAILPGMRYAKGLSLAPDLRAGVVSDSDIERHIDGLTERLRFFTPDVEPSKKEPGVFWLGASGLSLLHPSLKKWAGLIGSELSQAGFRWTVTVGFSRYALYATARAGKAIVVFETPDEERVHARTIPIVRLGFPPDLRDALAQLAITTLGGFIDLPEEGIRKRLGGDAYDLYKLARDELFSPLDSKVPEEPFVKTTVLDHPESHTERLMHVIEGLLDPILVSLQKQNSLLSAITVSLVLDNGDKRNEHLRPAAPTADAPQILRLIELRLQSISLVSGVVDITLDVEAAVVAHKQLELFVKKPRRDLKAAERAFAQLRAEFGDRVVMRARLRDGHLPEACYEWEPMDKLSEPTPRKIKARHLARRIFDRSMAFVSWARRQGDGRLTDSGAQRNGSQRQPTLRLLGGSARHLHNITRGHDQHSSETPRDNDPDVVGPYVVSGGWWMRRIHREYYFVRNPQGRWLWVYYDKRRKQTFVQGAIE
jgi:protein ImuB